MGKFSITVRTEEEVRTHSTQNEAHLPRAYYRTIEISDQLEQ